MGTMLTIEKKGNEKGFLNPVESGIRFGTIGEPVRFQVTGDLIHSIAVNIDVSIDEKASKPEWVMDTDEKSLTVKFKHPKRSERSGLSNAIGVAISERVVVGLMFWVETIGDAPSFRISYEFYRDVIASEKGCEE